MRGEGEALMVVVRAWALQVSFGGGEMGAGSCHMKPFLSRVLGVVESSRVSRARGIYSGERGARGACGSHRGAVYLVVHQI